MTAKQELRERIWDALEDAGVARFPFPPHGRIPNYAGRDDAAQRLFATDAWRDADTVKCNPDSPQRPVRRRALEDGKELYMAVPRLADERPFLRLDPDGIGDPDDASTISGADEHGEPVHLDAMTPIDLVVCGSVAVTPDGDRVGKGEGYSDLEFALLREHGRVGDDTPVATTVHELQVVEDDVATGDHDVPLDLIATPERLLEPASRPKPTGVDRDALDDERFDEIPALRSEQG
jgi:5-formyltetrahydrofolate cyclo-ligase